MKKLNFNIVLLGMIASGKDTQAKFLMKKYALKPVESGKHWREIMKEKSADGDWIRRTMGKGHPAPVALMKKFLVQEIAKKPKNKDLLFVGNPRLKPEAQLLKKLFEEKKQNFFALYVTLPEKEVYKRSLNRTIATTSLKIKQTKDKRNLDDKEDVIARRIAWHTNQVGKTVKYFQSLKKLKIINGKQTVPNVTKDILKAIEGYKKIIEN
ncbi:MAG: nucleoside monophosphate kinase [Candidatus Nomurabacteria bacterium]|nr:nucleoside monophosphate kinase [Candidatus Nomurabacteria bacterium]